MMMTLELFNASLALDFTCVVHTHLVKMRAYDCKEVPVPCFIALQFLMFIPGRLKKKMHLTLSHSWATNIMLCILHWHDSAMPASVEDSNYKPKENLLLKTSLVLYFSIMYTVYSRDASILCLAGHFMLHSHIYYYCSIVYFGWGAFFVYMVEISCCL